MRRVLDFFTRHEKHFFFALVLLHLLPIWCYRYVPTQDGSCHVYTAKAIQQYYQPDRELFRKYFTLDIEPDPYWTSNLILAGLLHAFPPRIAEKILVSLYVLLFPLSVRYLAASIERKNAFLGWLSLPFIFNNWYHLGFYNLCLSLPLYCFLLGYWFRHSLALSSLSKRLVVLALSLALYFTHPLTGLMLTISIFLLAAWMTLCDATAGLTKMIRFEDVWRSFDKRCGYAALAFLPFMVLMANFVPMFVHHPPRELLPMAGVYKTLERYLGFAVLRSFESGDIPIYWTLFVVLFGLMGRAAAERIRSRRTEEKDGFFFLAAATAIIFFCATPAESIHIRFSIFALLLAIACAAVGTYGRILQVWLQIVAGLSSALFVGNMIPYYARINRDIKDCDSVAQYLQPNRTVLYLCLERKGFTPQDRRMRFGPMRHRGNAMAAERVLVSLNDYEATEKYIPLQYRQELNPYIQLGGYQEAEAPWIDILGYSQRTGGTIDYLLIYGASRENTREPYFTQIWYQLEADYVMVYKSPSGLTGLFVRKALWKKEASVAVEL